MACLAARTAKTGDLSDQRLSSFLPEAEPLLNVPHYTRYILSLMASQAWTSRRSCGSLTKSTIQGNADKIRPTSINA